MRVVIPSAQTFTVTGYGSCGAEVSERVLGQQCDAAYVKTGDDVVIRGDAGQVLGTGKVGGGTNVLTGTTYSVNGQTGRNTQCRFPFTVSNIPEGQNVYAVTVGTVPPVNFSAAEIKRPIVIATPGIKWN
ncbi:MAG: hypothetical protein WCP28_01960 [Actinomycetes bacterium]